MPPEAIPRPLGKSSSDARLAKWRYRLVLAVGAALFIYGVVVMVTAPPQSAHFHTDPTPGDLTIGSGVLLAGAGFVVFAYGWWLWSRDTLPPSDPES